MGAAAGTARARLRFADDRHYDIAQHAIAAFAGYSTAGGWGLQASAGAILGGSLEGDEHPGEFDMSPGITGSVTGSRRFSFGAAWFATGSLSFSAASTSTESDDGAQKESLSATDLRIGAIAGRTFADVWSPYLLARFFAGPVSWTVDGEEMTGSDTTHVQLGAGLSVATESGLSAVLDVSVWGEQRASLGVSWQL